MTGGGGGGGGLAKSEDVFINYNILSGTMNRNGLERGTVPSANTCPEPQYIKHWDKKIHGTWQSCRVADGGRTDLETGLHHSVYVRVGVCGCACVRACERACVRARVGVCMCVHVLSLKHI